MNEEEFLERLRRDATPLRYEPDERTFAQIRLRIRDRIRRPTVTQLLAAWLRPVGVAMSAVALAAAIAMVTIDTADDSSFGEQPVEISMAGETYRVGE